MESHNIKNIFVFIVVLCHFGYVFLGAPMPKYDEQKCQSLSLENCLKDLQVFQKITDLPFTSNSSELDVLCNKCVAGYNCSSTLIENSECLSVQNKEILPLFVSMAQFMYLILCGDGQFTEKAVLRADFLEQSECIIKHKNEMKCCAEETHIPDLPVLRLMEDSSKSLLDRQISTCCPISRYIQCASNVAMQCGDKAANFTHSYIRRAAGEQVQGACQDVPNYPEPDSTVCPQPVPTCSGGFRSCLQNYLIGLAVFLIIWSMRQRV